MIDAGGRASSVIPFLVAQVLVARSVAPSVTSLSRVAGQLPRPLLCGRNAMGYEVAHSGRTRYLTVILIVVFALDGAASPLETEAQADTGPETARCHSSPAECCPDGRYPRASEPPQADDKCCNTDHQDADDDEPLPPLQR